MNGGNIQIATGNGERFEFGHVDPATFNGKTISGIKWIPPELAMYFDDGGYLLISPEIIVREGKLAAKIIEAGLTFFGKKPLTPPDGGA